MFYIRPYFLLLLAVAALPSLAAATPYSGSTSRSGVQYGLHNEDSDDGHVAEPSNDTLSTDGSWSRTTFDDSLINDSLAESLGGDELLGWEYCVDSSGSNLDDCIVLISYEDDTLVSRVLNARRCGNPSSPVCYSGYLILGQTNATPETEHVSSDGFILTMNSETFVTVGQLTNYSLELLSTTEMELVVNPSYTQYEMTMYDANGDPIKGGHEMGWTPISSSSGRNCEAWGDGAEDGLLYLSNALPVLGAIRGAIGGAIIGGGLSFGTTMVTGGTAVGATSIIVGNAVMRGTQLGIALGIAQTFLVKLVAPGIGAAVTALCEKIDDFEALVPTEFEFDVYFDLNRDSTVGGCEEGTHPDFTMDCEESAIWDMEAGEVTILLHCVGRAVCAPD